MYVVCSSRWHLSKSFYSRKSFLSSVLDFFVLFPDEKTVLVFRDLRSRGNPGDFQFLTMLNAKQIRSLKSKYLSD